ncbi:MAG: S16 family serine protease [Nitrososphaera sp.]
MHARLSYRNEGDGSLWLNNVIDVSEMNKASIINPKHAAEWLAGRTFNRDVTIEILSRRQTLEGRSWELMLTLGMISLLTGAPLRDNVTGSGRIGQNGKVLEVSSLSEKTKAARIAGYTAFLVSQERTLEDVSGIEVYGVEDIKQALKLATGLDELEEILLRSIA